MKHWKMQFDVAGSTDKIDCFDFEMTIDNVSKLDAANSPPFTTTRVCKTTWQVLVEVETVAKKMRVGLKRTDSSICDIKATMFFEIQNDRKEIYWRDSIEQVYNSKCTKYCYGDYLDMPNCQHSVPGINGGRPFKLSTDKIIMKGNVLVKAKVSISVKKQPHVLLNECLDDLKCDYKNLYYNPKFYDIEFRFANGKLLAHKNILISRSSVFEKTFEQNYIQNVIDVANVDKSVFDIFLLFLYSGDVEIKNTDLIMPLYELAYKYEVHKLSKICSTLLASDIKVKTATRILEMANTHEDTDLEEAVIGFVCKNFPEVSQTDDWNALLSSNPCFASMVLKKVSKSLGKCKSEPIVIIV